MKRRTVLAAPLLMTTPYLRAAHAPARRVVLSRYARTFVTDTIPVPRLAARMQMALQALARNDSIVRLTTVLQVDASSFFASARIRGADYSLPHRLSYSLPYGFWDDGQEHFHRSEKDDRGFVHDVPMTRLAEHAGTVTARFFVELVEGRYFEGELIQAAVVAAASPRASVKNSVTFDAASAASVNGPGSADVTWSHTVGSGSDRGVLGGGGCKDATYEPASFNVPGPGDLTEQWNLRGDSDRVCAGFTGVAPTSGSQTMTSSVTNGDAVDKVGNVVTLAGVHQTTPVGTAATASGSAATASITISTPASDSLLVDHCFMQVTSGLPVEGANQTDAADVTPGYSGTDSVTSYQSGSDGGAMSWTALWSTGYAYGGIEFKAAAGAPSSSVPAILMSKGDL